jgi:hypothetical protein
VSLRVRALRLVGLGRTYGVDFTNESGVRPLSVIAGEISTGKTTILEFIDYCLGAGRHPRHLEIERHVRSAMLEVEIDGQVLIIERATFTTEQIATVHRCNLSQLNEAHTVERRLLSPPGDPNSLSSLLLTATGMQGMELREAPTQLQSATDPLSFRDVMPLCFITNQRLDNKNLLLETQHMRALKLRQVIEIVFDVYDDQITAMGDQVDRMDQERRALGAEIAALDTFLREDDVPGRLQLDAQTAELEARLTDARTRLDELTTRMRAATAYAAEARATYAALRRASGEAAARVRDRETLLRRLLPLRGQYAEDERKLIFFQEAKQLFDPLRVRVCPACMQELTVPVEVEAGGDCSLCNQHIAVATEPVDIGAERAAVRTRLQTIERYIEEVERQLGEEQGAYEQALAGETAAQRRLDSDVAKDLSPFLAQRDELVRERETLRAERNRLAQQVRWQDGLERRRGDAAVLDARIVELQARIEELRSNRPDRNAVIADLTDRLAELLAHFGFPKLDEPKAPFLDEAFVPYVRGNRYTDIGSTGALTLISLAWQLALFERAIEQGQPHPGFLMIDSPQKNLMPEAATSGDEFADPAIPRRVWEHIVSWSETIGHGAQIIVIDNRPPDVAEPYIVVRYSGRAEEPPYGLIDDEVGQLRKPSTAAT